MAAVRKKLGWIGIDLGTRTVKLAQVQQGRGGLELVEALIVPRREPWDCSRELESAVCGSGDEIRAGLSLGTHFSGQHAAALLPMRVCDLRAMSVPPGDERQQRQHIAAQWETLAGEDAPRREFDFWHSQAPGDGQSEENVYALSVPHEWACRAGHDFRDAGLCAQTLDGLPLALARAVQLAGHDGRSPVGVLDWGVSRATFCVVQHQRPAFVRCLPECGFGQVIAALCQTLDVNWEEAQQLLVHHGLPHPAEDQPGEVPRIFAEVAAETVGRVVHQLRRTLTFLAGHRAALLPRRCWLLGGGATVGNLGPLLSHNLELRFEPWRPDPARWPAMWPESSPPALLAPAVALSCLAWEGS